MKIHFINDAKKFRKKKCSNWAKVGASFLNTIVQINRNRQ
ncbi:MAG: hypothetical protein ACI976_000408 [Aureispira sp.]|jgi:hypothetical protein